MIATAESIAASSEPKSRKRPSGKATARPVASKVKVTLCLDAEAARRLGVFAVMVGRDRSDVVSELVRDHLKRFRVQDLGGCDNGMIGEVGPTA